MARHKYSEIVQNLRAHFKEENSDMWVDVLSYFASMPPAESEPYIRDLLTSAYARDFPRHNPYAGCITTIVSLFPDPCVGWPICHRSVSGPRAHVPVVAVFGAGNEL